MLCTFRQRCRQTPQRSNRRPNRSMWTIMYRSVSSTFVTVCDFNPRLLSEKRFDEHLDPLPFDGLITITLKGLDESGIQTAYSVGNLLHPKPFNLNCTFWIRTIVSGDYATTLERNHQHHLYGLSRHLRSRL